MNNVGDYVEHKTKKEEWGIGKFVEEYVKYKGKKQISYLELFSIVWQKQRYSKLCLLLGVK